MTEAQYLAVSVSSSGNNTLVAPASGKRIRVLAFLLTAAGTTTAQFVSDGSPDTDLTGAMPMVANGTLTGPMNSLGWVQSKVNEPLLLKLSQAVAVAGVLVYVEV